MSLRSCVTAVALVAVQCSWAATPGRCEQPPTREQALDALRAAAGFFSERVAIQGGYVYHYSLDLQQRWGEGPAGQDLVWVQPPGTPSVGMALLRAYDATGDRYFLTAARRAADALVYGQVRSGGWSNKIDVSGMRRGQQHEGGQRRAAGRSSLDDGQTQSAIEFLIRVDQALDFNDQPIHDAARLALDSLLAAQFPNGGFPQVWKGAVEPRPVVAANYPHYDWRTEGRIKEYWDLYTLNDNVCGYVADALIAAHKIYDDPRYETALQRLGDFLILAQMPAPQRGWAQQYNEQMEPAWARAFEPPAVASDETQEAVETLLKIAAATADNRYLEPIPAALDYLQQSLLTDGRLARFYELETNRPLYMTRNGRQYSLTYDDSQLPSHYAFKIPARLPTLQTRYRAALQGADPPAVPPRRIAQRAAAIVAGLDQQGRWVSVYHGGRLVGQPKFQSGQPYLSSLVFCRNVRVLCDYLETAAF
ncbi:Pectic acid lyase [Posidoniimonas polymericola]|uniref:Pectic acid lyase n=1 Tax=Posidoniimonas polymericola TaxID=2528002 RepID=A0A5C5ZDX8_9BACT|nr:pectate lyase [Posidoniimonas polymericola]TWT85277.1 Pectic acid lyase [Posidoniimonas polymericola]